MKPGDLERVEQLFHAARRIAADERAAWLAAECREPDLLEEVERLLRAHDCPSALLSTPPLGPEFQLADLAAPEPEVGDRIGAYLILRRIGEGGMGTVFLAEQDRPRRRVALKVLRAGARSHEMLRRFRHEAEALGRLSHPGIAQVHEAGVEEHVPYLALEYIEGRSLLEFASSHALDLRQRLVLFLKVADAVQHAHSQGVIHRDLKPANILIEEHGDAWQPKILDFGIARIVDANSPAPAQTLTGQILGTLQYMSPEQASGDPHAVDARTDVHALGVLLFELLSGRPPYDLDGLGLRAATRVLSETEPRPLGPVVGRGARDLETLVGKALEKDREQRYPTASEFAADVRRFLDDLPILAHPPSAIYQLRKFARRNRALIVGAGAVLLAVGLGLGATLWQWNQARVHQRTAERRFGDLRELAQTFVLEFDFLLRDVAGTLEARRYLVETWLPYVDRLARDAAGDLDLQRQLCAAYTQIGDIQGAPLLPSLGDPEGALASYAKASAIVERLHGQAPENLDLLCDRISLSSREGDVLRELGRTAAATARYVLARDLAAEGLVQWPDHPEVSNLLAAASDRVASQMLAAGEVDEARAVFEENLAWTQSRLAAQPDDSALQRDLAVAHFKLGNVAHTLGDLDGAFARYERYREITARLAAASPADPVAQRDLVQAGEHIGNLHAAAGRPAQARAAFARGLAAGQALADREPSHLQLRFDLAGLHSKTAELELAQSALPAAEHAARRALVILDDLLERQAGNARFQRRRGVVLYHLGTIRAAQAESAGTDAERVARLVEARGEFARCQAHFVAMREAGLLAASDAGVPEEVAAELARCRAALVALGAEAE